MAQFDLTLPKFGSGDLDDEKQRRKIMNYLVKLDEQLRFVLNNLDAENFTETFQQIFVGSGDSNTDIESIRSLQNELGRLSTRVTQTANELSLKASAEELNELGDIANSLSAEIRVLSGRISTKVEQAVVDELGKRVSANSSTITQTAKDIRSEVADEVAGLESSITQTAKSIRGEISDMEQGLTAEIEATAGGLRAEFSDDVSGLQTGINANAKEIELVAGRRYGGRNYVMGTAAPYTAVGTGERRWLFPWNCADAEELKSLYGKTVTVSFDYDAAVASGSFQILINALWQGVMTFDASTGAGHFSKTIAVNSATVDEGDTEFIYIDGTWTGSVTFSKVKVEIGDVETDWSPHPQDAAKSVDAGGVVKIDQTGVHMSGGTIEMETSDGDEYIHIRNDGISASSLSAPNVTPRYSGPTALYVDPNATSAQIAAGNYFRSLADALAKISGRWVGQEITINLAPGMTEYGTITLRGVSGGHWIRIIGDQTNPAKLIGGLYVYFGSSPAAVRYLKIDAAGDRGIHIEGNGQTAEVYGCVITGKGGGYGICSARGANVRAEACEVYDFSRSLYGLEGGRLIGYNCKGNNIVGANQTTIYVCGTMPCDGPTWNAADSWAGQVIASSITVDQGSKPTPEAVPTTAMYNYTHSDSYCTGWSWISDDDVRQGYNGNRIYGVIWFDAAAIRTALSGKTINQASLRLHMHSGVGRGVSVSVQLYGTNMGYDGRSGAPGLAASYGTIGTTEPGEISEITIPVQAVKDIVSGKTQALVLLSDDTELYKDRAYSRNYARFSGSTTATAENCPRLTVVYK